ncbi:MAG: endonuclease/exonuclease/phosphatase family protein [Planctomycetota bacterium]|nr:endonuclease/exonuclease/phosphatase family protein [Planctomycetota bacterium]
MLVPILVATAALLVATLLPLWRHPHWLVRGMDFPRVQLAVAAVVLALAQLVSLDLSKAASLALFGVTLLCLGYQLWWILPYTRAWPVETQASRDEDPDRQLCILTANVLTSNRDADKLIELVQRHRPDVLVTLESDQWWQDQLACLEADMPQTMQCPQDNLYGMHVLSRLPLHEAQISFLVEDRVPSMHAILELPTGARVRAHFLHPAPPSPTENPESAERDAELVIVARSVADSDLPTVVAGDLNDVAWSRTTRLFRKLSGLLDPRVGRGMFNTFHVDHPLLRWPLDHLFHSKHFTVRSIERLPSIGSDHFPLLARLTLTPIHGEDQAGLTATEADQELATTIASHADVEQADVPGSGGAEVDPGDRTGG